MATERDVFETIIQPMKMFSSRVRRDDEDDALKQYVAALQDYSREDLQRGWAHLLKTYRYKSWPTYSDIVNAIEAVVRKPKGGARPVETDAARELRFRHEANEILKGPTRDPLWWKERIVDVVFKFYVDTGMTPDYSGGKHEPMYVPRLPNDREVQEMIREQRYHEKVLPDFEGRVGYTTLVKAAEINKQKQERAWKGGDYWTPNDPLQRLFKQSMKQAAE